LASSGLGWSGLDIRVDFQMSEKQPRQVLTVETVEPRSPASLAGLRHGDRILAVNGASDSVADRFRSLRDGEQAHLNVGDRTAVLRLTAPCKQRRVPLTMAFNALLGFVALAIGGYVFKKRPADTAALVLFVFTSLYALLRFSALGPVHRYGLDPAANLIQISVYLAASLFFFAALLHFCLIFPQPRPALANDPALLRRIYSTPAFAAAGLTMLLWMLLAAGAKLSPGAVESLKSAVARLAQYEVAGLAAATVFSTALIAVAVRSLRRNWRSAFTSPGLTLTLLVSGLFLTSAILRAVQLMFRGTPASGVVFVPAAVGIGILLIGLAGVMFVGYPVAACISFWRSYRESGSVQKRQIRWPLLGLVIAISGYLFTGPLLWVIGLLGRFPKDSIGSLVLFHLRQRLPDLALLLIPLSIAFAILKYRLMDIDVYIRKTVIYGGVTGILGLIYIAVAGGVSGLITRMFQLNTDWFPVATTAVLAILFVPIRSRLQGEVDRRFYRHRDYPAALARVTARLTEAGPARDVLQAITDEIQEAIPARSAALWLASREAPVFEMQAVTGGSESGRPLQISGEIAARAASAPGPISWDALAPAACGPLRAVAADYLAAIRRASILHGLLTVGSKLSDTDWDLADRRFLESVAGQVAIALDDSKPLGDTAEFERSREIQRALMPSVLPQPQGMSIAGAWQPAKSVGGDYYDVMELPDGAFALAVADVSGKGVPAALLMSNVQAMLRLVVPESRLPSVVCSKLNGSLFRNVVPGKYATFFYGLLDSAGRRLVYCNAGHNPPLLVRAGGELLRLQAGGPPLGLFQTAEYAQADVSLSEGDHLVIYTDGVVDAMSVEGSDFGEERLAEVLTANRLSNAEQMKSATLEAVHRHCGSVFSDDVTLLVLAVDGAAVQATVSRPPLPG
jgi:hypothetical protein